VIFFGIKKFFYEFSVDDSLNEQLLNCICSMAILALRLQLPKPRREVLKAICRAVSFKINFV